VSYVPSLRVESSSSLRYRLVAISQNLLLFGRKLTVAAGFDFALASKRRHLAQSLQRFLHFKSERRIRLWGGPLRGGTLRD
jgi:hypothetical protein